MVHPNSRFSRAAGFAAALLIAGCASVSDLAPEPDPAAVARAGAGGVDASDLVAGRRIYLTDCARCHAPVAVTSLTRGQWNPVLDRMAPLTRLDAEKDAQLRSYIEAVAPADPPD
ncbi:hypothetical protein KJ682_11870 [bacterium]|nr:hypothetical protein [bacterium]